MGEDGYTAANDRTKRFEDNATNGQPPEVHAEGQVQL